MNQTRIEWCDATWNPVTGCTPVSEGCANCYARRMARRLAGRAGYPRDDPFRVTFHEDRLGQPWQHRKPSVIFVCSMGDLFHEDVPGEFIGRVFAVMAVCSQHTFVVLTKRPERMLEHMQQINWFAKHIRVGIGAKQLGERTISQWPLPNVWLGVSAENQPRLDERMPHLMRLAEAGWHTVVSLEPLLGPADLVKCGVRSAECGVHGIILGGETGPGARPMAPDWVRKVRDDCKAAGAPFFFKQWGEWEPVHPPTRKGDIELAPNGESAVIPSDGAMWATQPPGTVVMRHIGRNRAGRILDDRTHDELPWKVKP